MGGTAQAAADRGLECGRLTRVSDVPTLLTIQQVAEQLKMHPETVRKIVRARRIGFYKLQGCIRISPEEIAEFLASCLSPAEPAVSLAQAVEQPRQGSAIEMIQRNRRMQRALDRRQAKP